MHKFHNLDEMELFLKNHKLPKLTWDETDNLNSVTIIRAEFIFKSFWKRNLQVQVILLVNSTKH